jgi:hypothetical protein
VQTLPVLQPLPADPGSGHAAACHRAEQVLADSRAALPAGG